ncbi:MAG: TolC family protein [Chitinophagaceae bacterium]
MKKHLIIMCGVFVVLAANSQDTMKTLSGQQVTEIVKRFHPVARQADLFMEKAKADVTIARGLFDPTLENNHARKTFDGTAYYNYNRPELNVPSWFGVEIRAGLEYLSGNQTDPTNTKGESSYLGISVPLAKNLLMDKRRAALQTAKIFRDASAVEKRNIINNLLQDALKSYWNWAASYQTYRILSNAVLVNEKRVQLVQTAYRLGDRPAIDTTEALTQLQNFEVLKSQAWLDFQNAGLELSLYLWTDQDQPYYLPESVLPADELQQIRSNEFVLPELNAMLEDARKNHPELLLYDFKLNALAVEKKLKFQELLPAVNFRYNQLGRGYNIAKTATTPLFENNFQYGISLGIPLRLSQGRGEYRKTRLKITETQLGQNQKKLELENKVKSYFNELAALTNQLRIQEQAWVNYAALQRGEETRFRAGESSLFLVNARENKALEAFQKLQELKAKYFKTTIAIQWAAGLLANR